MRGIPLLMLAYGDALVLRTGNEHVHTLYSIIWLESSNSGDC